MPLPAQRVVAALPEVAAKLGAESDHFQAVAEAIITTDLVEKTAFARFEAAAPEVDGRRASSRKCGWPQWARARE